ncbi:hypothetical protein ACHMW6_00730 [Pseudoduganella sp. UC29_106]|uniref:hypothetical protein n=1 Tax=Pseudoduganella sp. UC29_106 TaxID=3374553 RepID=UPI003756CAB1
MKAVRRFRGAMFDVNIRRTGGDRVRVWCNGEELAEAHVGNIEAGKRYQLDVTIP